MDIKPFVNNIYQPTQKYVNHQLVAEVIRFGPKDSTRQFNTLLALASRADPDGNRTCFPTQQTIARDARLSLRTVQRALPELVEAGFIKIKRTQTHNIYTIQEFVPPEPPPIKPPDDQASGWHSAECHQGTQTVTIESKEKTNLPISHAGTLKIGPGTPPKRDKFKPKYQFTRSGGLRRGSAYWLCWRDSGLGHYFNEIEVCDNFRANRRKRLLPWSGKDCLKHWSNFIDMLHRNLLNQSSRSARFQL